MLNIYVNGLSGKMGSSITHVVKDIDDLADGYGVVRMNEAKKIRKKKKRTSS